MTCNIAHIQSMGIASQAVVSDTGQTASTVDAPDDFHPLAALSPREALSTSLHDGLKHSPCFDSTTVLPSLPAVPNATDSATTPPPDDYAHYSSMNLIVGGALAPIHVSPPRQQTSRPHPGFRLPSFEALGIAAPHPDRFGGLAFNYNAMNGAAAESVASSNSDFDLVSAFNATQISMQLKHPLDPKLLLGSSRTIATPIRHDVATLTPPADTGDIQHNPISAATISHSAMESPGNNSGGSSSLAPYSTVRNPVQLSPGSGEGNEPTTPRSWITGALDVVRKSTDRRLSSFVDTTDNYLQWRTCAHQPALPTLFECSLTRCLVRLRLDMSTLRWLEQSTLRHQHNQLYGSTSSMPSKAAST